MITPGTAPARPVRPAVVTVAFWLQIAAVAVLLVLAALVVVGAVYYDGQIDEALRQVPDADPMEVSDERSGNVFMALTMGVPALLLAAWLAATAMPLRRGSNTARILVFVAAGAQLLLCVGQSCGGLLVIPFLLAVAMGDPGYDPALDTGPEGADWEQSKFLDVLYGQGDPGTVLAFGGIGVALVLVLTAAIVVLLLVPESRRWFRPSPAAWPAPLGYAYWPGYPAAAYPPAHPATTYPPGYPPAAYPPAHAAATYPPGYPPATYPPAVMPLPLCPDPALHLAHPPTGPSATAPDAGSVEAAAQDAGPWAPPASAASPSGNPAGDDAAPGATGQSTDPGAGISGS
ncbi:hypothetical protein [Micromonospora sp. SL4-19]|uniref:hypothetical protein n=1 Tax=Micromonospora sp. SL4-19 TaxID=3399129 RepID=UPI003A4DEBC2